MGRCEKLKWNRRKLGMTQKDLADKIGISVSTISKLETDETAWATVRDTTDNAISDILHKLGSWQCDIKEIIDNYESTKNDNTLCDQLKKKRLALEISQTDLGRIVGVDKSTISKYENKDDSWKNKENNTVQKLINFIKGEYDNKFKSENIIEYNDVDERKPVIEESNNDIKNESIEEIFNSTIDFLQEKISDDGTTMEDIKVYVCMISGICNGYLQGR